MAARRATGTKSKSVKASASARARIVAKAWADPDFKKRLRANPARVLRAEGISVPARSKVHVHEEGGGHVHLVLPKRPRGISETKVKQKAAQFTACVC